LDIEKKIENLKYHSPLYPSIPTPPISPTDTGACKYKINDKYSQLFMRKMGLVISYKYVVRGNKSIFYSVNGNKLILYSVNGRKNIFMAFIYHFSTDCHFETQSIVVKYFLACTF